MILVILGPLVWRLVVQANADDMRVVGILLIVLVTFAVFVLALMGGMWAFSRMALRFLQQDDADEIRKAQQLNSQLARAAQAALRGQASAQDQQADVAQSFAEAWGRQRTVERDNDGSYRESLGGDLELG